MMGNWRTIQRRRFERMSLWEIIEYAEHLGELRGARGERERVIGLLERRRCGCSSLVCIPVCRHALTVDEVMELIRGENE